MGDPGFLTLPKANGDTEMVITRIGPKETMALRLVTDFSKLKATHGRIYLSVIPGWDYKPEVPDFR